MPKLLIFVPCQKVIVSAQDNTASLIAIIETFTIGIPEGAGIAEDAVIPMDWNIFAMWELEDGEEDKKFEQRIDFILRNGRNALENATSTLDFTPNSNRFRNVHMVKGFPIPPQGNSTLKVSVREVGQEDWQEVGDFSILIHRPTVAAQITEAANESVTTENVQP
jgi:hypothetical protein